MIEPEILIGDCLETLASVPDDTVHTCVTSPPYFGLRDYGRDGQLGMEPTPDEFVEALVRIFREVRRVLRDDGTVWLNLGDSYASGGRKSRDSDAKLEQRGMSVRPTDPDGIKPKDLIGIPWRVAFALQADGWYLRQDIIWQKPNPMPESVRDRCTKAHEYVFLLSKGPRYYYDHEAIKEPAKEWTGRAGTFDRSGNAVADHVLPGQAAAQHRPRPSKRRGEFAGKTEAMSATGQNAFRAVVPTRNKRSVWSVASRPYKGAHFATFPPDLVLPCVLAGAPEGGIVLDPFGGSGTTAGVAVAHDRLAILCELNPEYAELVPERIEWIKGYYEKKQNPNTRKEDEAMTDLTNVQIESGVPFNKAEAKKMPAKNEPHPLEPKLRVMAPGDSFFVPDIEAKDMQKVMRLGDRIGVYLHAKTMKDPDGARTWRRNLDQLPKGRRVSIAQKVESGEFEPEDLSYQKDGRTAPVDSPLQTEEQGTLYWHSEEDDRYYKTVTGDDTEWFRDNCEEVTEEAYRGRTRWWGFEDGSKPAVTQTPVAGQGYEEDTNAYELFGEEYADAMQAWEARNKTTPKLRYFLNEKTNTPIRVESTRSGRYVCDPDNFIEISEKEYDEARETATTEDDDDEFADL